MKDGYHDCVLPPSPVRDGTRRSDLSAILRTTVLLLLYIDRINVTTMTFFNHSGKKQELCSFHTAITMLLMSLLNHYYFKYACIVPFEDICENQRS